MRRRNKIVIVGAVSLGAVIGLLLTAVVATRLLANREMVRSLITTKIAQATGGTLEYDRLSVNFFPLPHLETEGIGLHRPDAFDIKADEMSVYPRILPLLKGRLSIRRLVVEAPNLRFALGPGQPPGPESAPAKPGVETQIEETIRTVVGGLFGALATIDPGTDLLIQDGTVTLVLVDAPDLTATDIQLYGENDGGSLSLNLECRSAVTGRLDMSLQADNGANTARGTIRTDSLNLRPILHYASLPGDVETENTHARVESSFTIDSPEKVTSRFSLKLPALTVKRKGQKLDFDSAFISGGLAIGPEGVALSVDTLRSVRPALNLSAGARILPDGKTGRSIIAVHAAASQLDVTVAERTTLAIAHDLEGVRTAFAIAKEGHLINATYNARLETENGGFRLISMQAKGHLNKGRVTIPGIEADLEDMDGDVVYQDQQVRFKNVSGHFKGAAFEKLEAVIDWEADAKLSINSSAVRVDAKPFSEWLLSFDELAPTRDFIRSMEGSAHLSQLTVKGPLTDPGQWDFEIRGTPAHVQLSSPLVPFDLTLSGGEIVYHPGNEHATNVTVTFLDGSTVASFQAKGIVGPESITGQLDGSIGPQTIDWLSTILPIPEHLQMNPPVDLTGVSVAWSSSGETAIKGSVKTAGGVEVFADVSISPQTWNLHRFQFSDGRSQAVVSARKEAQQIEMSFTGHVEKLTADRLLETNHSLTGRLEGDFRAIIDTRMLMNSTFAGHLSGEGLQIHQLLPDPVEVQRFSIEGNAGRILIAPSEILLQGHRLLVDGNLKNRSGDVTFDLNVDADRLDAELIQSIQSAGEGRTDSSEKAAPPSAPTFTGSVRIRTDEFAYGKLIWSPVEATVHMDGEELRVHINQAEVCGITTTGEIALSSAGLRLHITPRAHEAPLQETSRCFWDKKLQAEASYDLEGEILLPATTQDPLQSITGRLDLSSQNGRIAYSSMLMKILSVINVTESFTGGASDLQKEGYGYKTAQLKMGLRDGKVRLEEILLDGNSLTITGQGSVDLKSQDVDIKMLAAPLKTIDRVVNKIPVINYIAGGSLVSIPLRVTGKINNVSVTTMAPSDVGKGLLNIMGRTLNAPFKLAGQAASGLTGGTTKTKQTPEEAASESQ